MPDPAEALAAARERAGGDGAVLVTGSIYLLAELVRRAGVTRSDRRGRSPMTDHLRMLASSRPSSRS